MLEKFHYGVCYYPEHCDAKRHAHDIARIADCGFNFIRMGEGAWSYWEPTEGKFQFELFDKVIDLCKKHGIKVILGTPTYAAPAWVSNRYPDVLRWNFSRVPMKHGSRRNLNYTSPRMLELSDRICTALAEHYQHHKSVIGWQLDNEFNCHMDVSYAPSDAIAFREWLADKYKTISRLNEAWGTKFWSQEYTDFDEVDLPHPTSAPQNPSQLLDETRFISETVVRFAQRQADILRRTNKHWSITHNHAFGNIDPPRLAEVLDFYCCDQYPLFFDEWTGPATTLITSRSLSFPFGVMEQQSGPGGQMDYLHRSPQPGELRLWAWQSIAHGARLLSYFCWRTCTYGAEQRWHGLIDHDDKPTRRVDEAKLVATELKKLPDEFHEAVPVKTVAILRKFENETEERRISTYAKSGAWEEGRWLSAMLRAHVPVDMIWRDGDWVGYKLIVAAHVKLVSELMVSRLTEFVEGGGTVVLGAQSGLLDTNCHMVQRTPPGRLAQLAGIEVEDFTMLKADEARFAGFSHGPSISLSTYVERLRLREAEPIATWNDDDPLLAGGIAISRHRVGKGQCIYVGGYCSQESCDQLTSMLLRDLHVRPIVDAGDQVEVVARQIKKQTYLALLNHSKTAQPVSGIRGQEMLSGNSFIGTTALPPFGVAIVKLSK